jgi:hypothetical protein
MAALDCGTIRESLVTFFASEIAIDSLRESCVITLPIRMLDDRYVTVYVEKRTEDFFLVHDGGKTIGELYALGVHLTDTKAELFSRMAKTLGGNFGDRLFQAGCKIGGLHKTILAIAQCQVQAMAEVLSLRPALEDESFSSRVRRTLDNWKPRYVKSIAANVTVKGRHEEHRFDFVSHPRRSTYNTVAIKILAPSVSPLWQADRYGFFVLDIEKTAYKNWPRLALVTKSDMWNKGALQLVKGLSDEVIETRTGEEDQIETVLPRVMTHLSKAS